MPGIEENDPAKAEDTLTGQQNYICSSCFTSTEISTNLFSVTFNYLFTLIFD